MITRRQKPEFERPTLEDLATRRKRQAIEGPKAMQEYRDAQEAVYQRTAALREERLPGQIKEGA